MMTAGVYILWWQQGCIFQEKLFSSPLPCLRKIPKGFFPAELGKIIFCKGKINEVLGKKYQKEWKIVFWCQICPPFPQNIKNHFLPMMTA